MRLRPALVIVCLFVTGCSSGRDVAATVVARHMKVEVVATHPHDPTAFTEGLVVTGDDRMFESSGEYGASDVREVELDSGRVLRRQPLGARYFGEGLADSSTGELVQLTWREATAFRWRPDDLAPAGQFTYSGEGWGLTRDGGDLVQSDGSDRLTFRDPSDFSVRRTVRVTEDGQPVEQLNELEAVGSVIYANVWKTTDVLAIDPATGRVTEVIDASSLVPPGLDDPDDVLNGIAHRPGTAADRLLLTGKRWPSLFDVRVVPA